MRLQHTCCYYASSMSLEALPQRCDRSKRGFTAFSDRLFLTSVRKFARCQIQQRSMRPDLIVVQAPWLDRPLRIVLR